MAMASAPVLKTVIGTGGALTTQAVEPTSMMNGMAMAGGAAAGGGLAFLMCVSKCPGGKMGALAGIAGAMNPFSMLSKKDEDDAKNEEEEEDSMKKMREQVNTIEKELCNMNCKMAGLLGAAGGAAAGNAIANKVNQNNAAGGGGMMGGMGGGGGGGGMMGGGGGFKLQMLDEWNAPQFFVVTKQIDNLQKDIRCMADKLSCESPAAGALHRQPSESRRSQVKFDFF
mmetsp:Transcript_223/g.607  ORF Transcript_223/g.607 Transcript_223/m.607 type:complete len:227 (-) Transcript_223:100-780(-)